MASSKKNLQPKHLDNVSHQERNLERQQRQAEVYDKNASIDKRIINNMEPVYVRNTIKKIWKPGVILNIPNPIRELRTYIADINGKVYYRNREHLKPRTNNMPRELNEQFELPIQPLVPMPSSSTNSPLVNTPEKGEIPQCLVKLSARKETASY